jgi:hypothetical protein
MDTTKKSKLKRIIRMLKDDLDIAQSELTRLDFIDEVANPLPDVLKDQVVNDNLTSLHTANGQYGVVKLPIHFTLGRGMSEALGDEVEKAVFNAFRKVSRGSDAWGINHQEMGFSDIGTSIGMYWDGDNQCVCLHLELVHTDEQISMDEFNEQMAVPPGRFLN